MPSLLLRVQDVVFLFKSSAQCQSSRVKLSVGSLCGTESEMKNFHFRSCESIKPLYQEQKLPPPMEKFLKSS